MFKLAAKLFMMGLVLGISGSSLSLRDISRFSKSTPEGVRNAPSPSQGNPLPFPSAAGTAGCFARAPARTADTEELQNEIAAINLQLDYLKLKVRDSQADSITEARIKEKQSEVTQPEIPDRAADLSQTETTAQIARLEEESKTGREQLKSLLAPFRARPAAASRQPSVRFFRPVI